MAEEERNISRFAHLLQPYRDLAANWSVDVAQELDQYISELHLSPVLEDGQTCLNFAEAALLIQGSIQVYSKKVEYLYVLVLQALEFISQTKQSQSEKGSVQSDGKHAGVEEEAAEGEEEQFLNLDDVPEEANIDIDDEVEGSLSPVQKPPASLLVVEGDTMDMPGGEAGELAGYQIATSYLHRDFLLLDPCDAEAVDRYLNINQKATDKGTPSCIPSSLRRRNQRESTPGRRASSAKKAQSENIFFDTAADGDDDDGEDPWVGEARNIDFDNPCLDKGNPHPPEAAKQEEEEEEGEGEEEEEADPWAPLNPHQLGTLLVMPFKPGKLQRKIPKPRNRFLPVSQMEFPLATKYGTSFPEFRDALQAKESTRTSKTKLNSKQHNPAFHPESEHFDTAAAAAAAADDDDDANDHDDAGGGWDANIPEDAGESFRESETQIPASEDKPLEHLCHAPMDAMLKKIGEAEQRTLLAERVSNWKQKIEVTLDEQESRPPFDIHVYGDRLIEECVDVESKPFTDLVKGQQKHDVARSFAALLQLVNNGNVKIEYEKSRECFTAEFCFSVKLVNSQRRHEDMLHYQPPSKANDKKKMKMMKKMMMTSSPSLAASCEQENLDPLLSKSSSSTTSSSSTSTSTLTPNGKRRRKRRPPLHSLIS